MQSMRPLVLLGFMGSGKTTVGRRAATLAGTDFRDLDLLIEDEAGMSIPAFFGAHGEAAFRALEAALVGRALARPAIVAVGGGTPMDEASWELLHGGARTVWLDAPLPELLRRADADSRPMLKGRTGAEIEALYRARASRYAEADHRVPASGPIEEVVQEVVRLWDA